MSLIAGVATTAYSWFSAGSAGKWYAEVGSLLNDSCDGGVLESLEKETNKSYPHLEAMRQDCVNKWRDYQRAMPWSKGATLQTYQNTVESFANAVASEEQASYNLLSGGLGAISEAVKKPIVIIILVVLMVIFMVMLLLKKR